MNVRCPYCGCNYDISSDLLKDPIGSERLGYGWWLRCYKCQKKFWLKNSDAARDLESHLKADRQSKINKISSLSRKNKTNKKANDYKTARYVIFMILISIAIIGYYNKEAFVNFLISKAKYVSKSVAKKLSLNDVKYKIEDEKITVSGTITNEDRLITNINEIKITVLDGDKEVKSWDVNLETNALIPGDKTEFSSENTIENKLKNIKVEVSIY